MCAYLRCASTMARFVTYSCLLAILVCIVFVTALCSVAWHMAVCTLDVLCCVCGILGHLAPVHRCARSARYVACAVSSATWLLFTGVLARCVLLCVACAVLRVQGVAAGRTLVHPDGGF